ncbi:hypothetical protein MED01_002369 [Micromonospora sp. MED01]|uniref:hypothetical protein n=1 Tax=Micromonospora alfalfae TaxID=2911212 RepID=UPI001EE8DC02|nr:hypothetical protein [Micromonospora alfalfae]MCG5464204.1 hypothetical protein [Micromonospora alfalfae]
MIRATRLNELIEAFDKQPDRNANIRVPYKIGALVAGSVADAIAYGRSLGLTIDTHKGGGWLVRRGYLTAHGRAGDLRRFLSVLAGIQGGRTR